MEYILFFISSVVLVNITKGIVKELEQEVERYCNEESSPEKDFLWIFKKHTVISKSSLLLVLLFLLPPSLITYLDIFINERWALISVFWTLLSLSIVDFKLKIIPDSMSLLLFMMGIAFAGEELGLTLSQSIEGAIIGFIIMYIILWTTSAFLKKEAMGMGDVKLMAGIGSVVGLASIPSVLLVGSISALIYTAFHKDKKVEFSFGPFLSLATIIAIMLNTYGINLNSF